MLYVCNNIITFDVVSDFRAQQETHWVIILEPSFQTYIEY